MSLDEMTIKLAELTGRLIQAAIDKGIVKQEDYDYLLSNDEEYGKNYKPIS